MELTYKGDHLSVDVETASGVWVSVPLGSTADFSEVDVPARIAQGFTTGNVPRDAKIVADAERVTAEAVAAQVEVPVQVNEFGFIEDGPVVPVEPAAVPAVEGEEV